MKLNKLFKGNYNVLLSAATFALLGIQAAKADYPSTILADNPLGFYRLDETGLATTAVDSSASGAFPGVYVQNYGGPGGTTIYPVEGLPGIDTNSIELSAAATPDYVAVGYYSQFNQPGPFSFEIWVYPTSVPTGGNYRCPIGNSPAYDDTILSGWYVYQTPDVPSELALVSPSAGVFITTTSYSIDNWYYIAGTYDGTNMSFYLNGVLVGSQSASGYTANSANSAYTGTFSIGQRGDGYGNFDGNLDDAAFYTNTLTAAQILTHYEAGTNSFRVSLLPPSKCRR
ncbi:MAG: LamG domain-containing protein, partial [Verrucomicrobiota bacterium]